MEENEPVKFERIELGQSAEAMLRDKKIWKVFWELVTFIPEGIIEWYAANIKVAIGTLVVWVVFVFLIAFVEQVLPGIGKSVFDWMVAERSGFPPIIVSVFLLVQISFNLAVVGIVIKELADRIFEVLFSKRLLKMLRVWNELCRPELNRFPRPSQISNPELAEEIRCLYLVADAVQHSLRMTAMVVLQDYSNMKQNSKLLANVRGSLKRLRRMLKEIELGIQADFRARTGIPVSSDSQQPASISSRQRAKQLTRIERAKHLDNWEKH